MKKRILAKRKRCLELAVGGAIQLYEEIEYMEITDINDLTWNNMLETYRTEYRINKNRKKYQKGRIGNRF